MKILLIDNYDSFTFNLLHYLQIAGATVDVVRNDEISPSALHMEYYDAALLSPGPCTPLEAGGLMDFIRINVNKKPLLGICLGMQALAMHCNWKLTKARTPMHGKQSLITHNGDELFHQIPNPMLVGRYHSLIVLPEENSNIKPIAFCENEAMAIGNETKMIYGVQFHPESILTPDGQVLIANWIKMVSALLKTNVS